MNLLKAGAPKARTFVSGSENQRVFASKMFGCVRGHKISNTDLKGRGLDPDNPRAPVSCPREANGDICNLELTEVRGSMRMMRFIFHEFTTADPLEQEILKAGGYPELDKPLARSIAFRKFLRAYFNGFPPIPEMRGWSAAEIRQKKPALLEDLAKQAGWRRDKLVEWIESRKGATKLPPDDALEELQIRFRDARQKDFGKRLRAAPGGERAWTGGTGARGHW